MSSARLTLIALGMAFAVPALGSATGALALGGTWRSEVDETPLSSAYDESIWGKNAKAVRTVQMAVRPTGDATLTVTRKVIDGRGRTVAAATSIEHVDLILGAVERSTDVRSDLAVTVKRAERRYPDDPEGTWALDGLRVSVSTFPDNPRMLEVRVDTPEGRGSFWETLRRGTSKPSTTR